MQKVKKKKCLHLTDTLTQHSISVSVCVMHGRDNGKWIGL